MREGWQRPDGSAGKAEEGFAKIGIVECMAFSSDGRLLGVSTADGSLTIYDKYDTLPAQPLKAKRQLCC